MQEPAQIYNKKSSCPWIDFRLEKKIFFKKIVHSVNTLLNGITACSSLTWLSEFGFTIAGTMVITLTVMGKLCWLSTWWAACVSTEFRKIPVFKYPTALDYMHYMWWLPHIIIRDLVWVNFCFSKHESYSLYVDHHKHSPYLSNNELIPGNWSHYNHNSDSIQLQLQFLKCAFLFH